MDNVKVVNKEKIGIFDFWKRPRGRVGYVSW